MGCVTLGRCSFARDLPLDLQNSVEDELKQLLYS